MGLMEKEIWIGAFKSTPTRLSGIKLPLKISVCRGIPDLPYPRSPWESLMECGIIFEAASSMIKKKM